MNAQTLEMLKNFDLSNLDALEVRYYNHYIKQSTKEQVLQVIINTVEGDYSQLDPVLAKIAKLQDMNLKSLFVKAGIMTKESIKKIIKDVLDEVHVDHKGNLQDFSQFKYSDLKQISIIEAEELFNKGLYIYIKHGEGPVDVSRNTFLLSRNGFDGSMNIYTAGQKPAEYGFKNIIKWIIAREKFVLQFYTLYSDKPISVEPDMDINEAVVGPYFIEKPYLETPNDPDYDNIEAAKKQGTNPPVKEEKKKKLKEIRKLVKSVINEELAVASDGGYYNKPEHMIIVTRSQAAEISKIANEMFHDLFEHGGDGVIAIEPNEHLKLEIINKLREAGIKIENDSEEGTELYFLSMDELPNGPGKSQVRENQIEEAKEEFKLVVDNLYDKVVEDGESTTPEFPPVNEEDINVGIDEESMVPTATTDDTKYAKMAIREMFRYHDDQLVKITIDNYNEDEEGVAFEFQVLLSKQPSSGRKEEVPLTEKTVRDIIEGENSTAAVAGGHYTHTYVDKIKESMTQVWASGRYNHGVDV